jgi:hypothetical protein
MRLGHRLQRGLACQKGLEEAKAFEGALAFGLTKRRQGERLIHGKPPCLVIPTFALGYGPPP